MDKFTYRLDLTEDEFNLIKNNLNEKLLSKVKKIKVSEKKTNSMLRATMQRSEIARARFFDAMYDLLEQNIEVTQYNLKKYKDISYHTSKKYLDMLSFKDEYEYEVIETYTEEELEDRYKFFAQQHENEEFTIYDYEKKLLKQWDEIKARKEARKKNKE